MEVISAMVYGAGAAEAGGAATVRRPGMAAAAAKAATDVLRNLNMKPPVLVWTGSALHYRR
jgi:hypothetical protein